MASKRNEKKDRKARSRSRSVEKYPCPPSNPKELRAVLLQFMSSDRFVCPVDSLSLFRQLRILHKHVDGGRMFMRDFNIDTLLLELSERDAIGVEEFKLGNRTAQLILNINRDKIQQLARETSKDRPQKAENSSKLKASKQNISPVKTDEVDYLINIPTARQRRILQESLAYEKILLKQKKSERELLQKFRSKVEVSMFCPYGSKEACERQKGPYCKFVHYRRIITPYTDISLGDCSYLDSCRNMATCKYIHYCIEGTEKPEEDTLTLDSSAQWINCDLRTFDMTKLGKFSVIMADPPWDIHMDLPYGTMRDSEVKNMGIDLLQDTGVIFLWVTGRAWELGIQCLKQWGYRKTEEIIWVKTNQLHRVIRTGRTGHWLNHSKEHWLIGIKGEPQINRNVDCDVIVSEVRETSRKPDEIYEIIERMVPDGRRLELFGREHNVRPGWLTLGNQLPDTQVTDPALKEALE